MQTKWFVRAGAGLFVAIVATVSVLEVRQGAHEGALPLSGAGAAIAVDPLRTELLHCQSIGQAGASDASCLRAWAENRRRFLAPGARSEASPAPVDPNTSGAIPGMADSAGARVPEGR